MFIPMSQTRRQEKQRRLWPSVARFPAATPETVKCLLRPFFLVCNAGSGEGTTTARVFFVPAVYFFCCCGGNLGAFSSTPGRVVGAVKCIVLVAFPGGNLYGCFVMGLRQPRGAGKLLWAAYE